MVVVDGSLLAHISDLITLNEHNGDRLGREDYWNIRTKKLKNFVDTGFEKLKEQGE